MADDRPCLISTQRVTPAFTRKTGPKCKKPWFSTLRRGCPLCGVGAPGSTPDSKWPAVRSAHAQRSQAAVHGRHSRVRQTTYRSAMDGLVAGPVATALVSLVFAWLVGNTLLARLERDKKLTERDIAALNTYYDLYGEFFATWKEWSASAKDEEAWRHALTRAAGVEGKYESLLVMMCSSRVLSEQDAEALGAFRQALQQLRGAVKRRENLEWWASEIDEYLSFKTLAARVADLLQPRTIGWAGRAPKRPDPATASRSLVEVTSNKYEARWVEVAMALGEETV